MATFIQRSIYDPSSNYETDGGGVDHTLLFRLLVLFNASAYSAAQLHQLLGCTPAQEAELEEVLNTRPNQPAERAQWAERVIAHLFAGSQSMPGHIGASEVRVSLGLSA